MPRYNAAYFNEDFSPKKCRSCGYEEFEKVVRDWIDFGVGAGPVSEFEVRCKWCGDQCGYWAYGYYDPSFAVSSEV